MTTTFINSKEDMKWLREVHLHDLPPRYKSAIIEGNEDYPDEIKVYDKKDPLYTDIPVIYIPDDNGVYHQQTRSGLSGSTRKCGFIGRMFGLCGSRRKVSSRDLYDRPVYDRKTKKAARELAGQLATETGFAHMICFQEWNGNKWYEVSQWDGRADCDLVRP